MAKIRCTYLQFKYAIQLAILNPKSFLYFWLNTLMNSFRYIALWDSGLGLISSLRYDGRKGIQSVNSAWSILHLELQAQFTPSRGE